MLALPPGRRSPGGCPSTRLARDHYIRLDSNDYSVHPSAIGRRIEVTAGLDRVTVYVRGPGGRQPSAGRAWHQTITDPAHLAAARALRRDRVTIVRPPREAEVQIRSPGRLRHRPGAQLDGSVA